MVSESVEDATNTVSASGIEYRYGRAEALRGVDLSVPAGALYALLGPNGSGKTTLLQVLAGIRRATRGQARVLGRNSAALTYRDRQDIGYVAEGQQLPRWMRLEQLEAYLAPLYPRWDRAFAANLRDRFSLDPRRTIGTLSRGEYMKAALLCALAARPKLLLMDEPFTGMDVSVKDDIVRGLLDSAANQGWTVMISSHDIAELESLVDWVGFLDRGMMRLSESMETLRARFKHVDVVDDTVRQSGEHPAEWLATERAGRHLRFVVPNGSDAWESRVLRPRFPDAQHIEVRDASLREVFIAMAEQGKRTSAVEAVR